MNITSAANATTQQQPTTTQQTIVEMNPDKLIQQPQSLSIDLIQQQYPNINQQQWNQLQSSMVLTQPSSTMQQQQQQQQQQFEQHHQQQQQPSSQVESKFRIIKTDSNASRSTDNPSSDQTDSSSSSAHQIVEDTNDAHLPHSHQQAASLNIIGNYQRRGRWLVKDFSPDQLVQGMKTGVPAVQHHQTVDEAYMNAHLHQANANQTLQNGSMSVSMDQPIMLSNNANTNLLNGTSTTLNGPNYITTTTNQSNGAQNHQMSNNLVNTNQQFEYQLRSVNTNPQQPVNSATIVNSSNLQPVTVTNPTTTTTTTTNLVQVQPTNTAAANSSSNTTQLVTNNEFLLHQQQLNENSNNTQPVAYSGLIGLNAVENSTPFIMNQQVLNGSPNFVQSQQQQQPSQYSSKPVNSSNIIVETHPTMVSNIQPPVTSISTTSTQLIAPPPNQSSPKEQQQSSLKAMSTAPSTLVSNLVPSTSAPSVPSVASNQLVNQPTMSILVSPLSSTSLGESINPIGSNFASTQSINDFITRDFMSDLSDENEKKTSDSGIHNRIEKAMDLVKTHLTSAVKEEIVALKNQIKQLKEACTRLEQENSILKQYATQETLMLLESRLQNSSTSSLTSHVIQQPIQQQQQQQQPVTFEIGYATSNSNDQNINVNVVAQQQQQQQQQQQHTDIQPSTGGQDLMTASFTAATTEHALNTNGYMLDQQKTAETLSSKDRPSV